MSYVLKIPPHAFLVHGDAILWCKKWLETLDLFKSSDSDAAAEEYRWANESTELREKRRRVLAMQLQEHRLGGLLALELRRTRRRSGSCANPARLQRVR
ncbi:hypothetical protein K402DRAFT_466951 [Aulographum hederae CBS 113979]|uniref:Uncharacterized protein n=1 Tax=Aulographum hederae CBS 113979 TaxID=1176131 RepID=A0A6G1GMK0_9PEZI|nr:hypothetical protein K402DRAFT_466951 [Aulographum hederae CBS 113979]